MGLHSSLVRSKSCIKNCYLLLSVGYSYGPTSPAYFSSHCRGRPFTPPPRDPPVPKKIPVTMSLHGETWQDPYQWMSNIEDPDFLEYLNEENSYAQAFMTDTFRLQSALASEMRSRIPDKISTPPERWGPWLYYQYIPKGKEYPVLCRRLGAQTSGWLKNMINSAAGRSKREERLLDWNELAEKYGYVNVGVCRVSPDHNFLAYTIDVSGGERFVLEVKDLQTKSVNVKMRVDGVVNLAWAQDGRTLFYTVSDDNQRPYRVLCRKLGCNEMTDVPVFTESDSRFCVDITSTKDGKFITVNSNSRTSSEVQIIDASNPFSGLQRVHKRVSGTRYFLEHHHGLFYIMTNAPLPYYEKLAGEEYYLGISRVEDVGSSDWQKIILPSEYMSIQDMDIFNRHLVLLLNNKGVPMMCSLNLPIHINDERHVNIQNLKPWYFPLPSSLCSISPGSNHDFMSTVYRAVLTSPVMPDVVVDYDMSEQTYTLLHQDEVKGVSSSRSDILTYKMKNDQLSETEHPKEESFQCAENQRWKDFSELYCCQRKEVVSHDGVKVPLMITYSKESWERKKSPGLLIGYGAYGEVLDKSWCSDRLSLLDRGWVVAFADVRGGGGDSAWHKSGSGLNKLNSVHDFISCAKYLVTEGYVSRDRLCAIGWSAGSLLAGAAVNLYPDLFRAAILKVPFLDIRNTLLDTSLPLTVLDHDEFGNPQMKSEFESISSYSPYDNIRHGSCYPSVLVTAAWHDSRVGVWEGAKWVAKLRDSACSDCARSVIMKTSMIGGHFGEGGLYSQCQETAYDSAFLMKAVGLN